MIRIGILGDIGSGKSFIAKNFGFPVFNADLVVANIYKKNQKIFKKLNKILPKYFNSFPVDKKDVIKAILDDTKNLKKIVTIVHLEVRKRMSLFLKKNKTKKIIVLDIPLLLENKINKKNDILIFVQTKKKDVMKKLKKRGNFNKKLLDEFTKIQLSLDYKKKKSNYVIKNDFTKKTVLKSIKKILKTL